MSRVVRSSFLPVVMSSLVTKKSKNYDKNGQKWQQKIWCSAAECLMQMYQAFTALILVQQRFLMFCSHVDGVDDRRAKEKKSTNIALEDVTFIMEG